MTPIEKLRRIADSTALDGVADAIRDVADEMERLEQVARLAIANGQRHVAWRRSQPLPDGIYYLTAQPIPKPDRPETADLFCKGAWELGTACGKCQRCIDTWPESQRQKGAE